MKKLLFLGVLFLSLSLTSCFELVEQISMNEDGTGEMTVTLNLNESKEQLKEFMQSEDGAGGFAAPDQKELDAFFKNIVATVSEVEGISNVKSDIFYEDFIFSISASFEQVEAMNEAVSKFTTGMTRGMLDLKNEYAYEKGTFKRSFQSPIPEGEYEKVPMMQRVILESARIISVYRFEKTIKGMSNDDTELSFDKKEARFESTLGDVVKGIRSPDNVISL